MSIGFKYICSVDEGVQNQSNRYGEINRGHFEAFKKNKILELKSSRERTCYLLNATNQNIETL